MDIPGTLGVMVLPRTVLLPGSLIPLYVFESRYREMLASALASHRVFALAHEPYPEAGSGLGSAGMIRACVAAADGTSHLMLQGIGRIRFLQWLPGASYRQAKVEKLPTPAFDKAVARSLKSEICDLCRDLDTPRTREFLKLTNRTAVEEFGDLAASSLVTDPSLRLRILEDADVTSRLSVVLAYLRHLRDAG